MQPANNRNQTADSVNNEKHLFQIKCSNNDEFMILGRPCELSAFSYVPQNRKYETAERSIFQTKKSTLSSDLYDYDRLFTVEPNFDNKVHRCDRKHAKLFGLDSWSEEVKKVNKHAYYSILLNSLMKFLDIS
jgi:hypothetical protein